MEKKSKLPLIIIIILLVLIILGLGAFICYEKGLFGGKDNEPKVVEKEYNLDKAKKLVDKYYITNYGSNTFTTGLTDEAKVVTAIFNTNIKESSVISCYSAYSNNPNAKQDSDTSFFISFESSRGGGCDSDTVPFYSYDAINETYKELYGEDLDIAKKSFAYEALIYDYLESNNGFAKLSCRCGGVTFDRNLYFVKSAKLDGDKLTVDVAYITLLQDQDSDFDDPTLETTIGEEKVTYKYSEVWKDNFEEEFKEKYYDKMDANYTFTFEKEDDHYILKNLSKK